MQHVSADAGAGRRAHQAVFAEIVRRFGAEAQAAAAVGRVGDIVQLQFLHLAFLTLELVEVIGRTHLVIIRFHVIVQEVGEVFPGKRLGRRGRYYLEAVLRTGKGHVEDIDVVDGLHLNLFPVLFLEEGIGRCLVQLHAVDAIGLPFQGRSRHLRPGPGDGGLVQSHLLCKGNYHEREFQALGFVDGHHPHGIARRRRGNLGPGLFPVAEEGVQFVAAGGRPFLEIVHEGLDVRDFGLELVWIRLPEVPEDGFRQFHQRVIPVRDFHLQGACHIAGHVGLSLARNRFYQRQLGHQPAHRDGGLHIKRIVRNHRVAVRHQFRGYPGAFVVAAHEDGHIGPLPSPFLHLVQGFEDLSHLVFGEEDLHRTGGRILEADFLVDIGIKL